jgi:hypothetical protein
MPNKLLQAVSTVSRGLLFGINVTCVMAVRITVFNTRRPNCVFSSYTPPYADT